MLAGDDVKQTLRGAPCPVAIAPPDHALCDVPITSVGVGWDGDDAGDRALEVAHTAGSGTGASVHAMATVALVDLALAHGIPDPPDVVLTCPDGTIEDDIPATMLSGQPLELLEHYAAEVDVLIVGSHERSAVDPLLPWSTSGHLARRCRHPLIAVPNGTINVATPQGSGQ